MSLKIKNINIIKILLDVAMVVLLVLMYNTKVISLNFHELGGLIVCSLFLVHKLLNWKWIGAVSKKIFRRDLKLKPGLVILLLLTFNFGHSNFSQRHNDFKSTV